MKFVYLFASILIITAAHLLLKQSIRVVEDLSIQGPIKLLSALAGDLHFWAAMACSGFGIIIWLQTLRNFPVSIAVPSLSLSLVLLAFAAHFFFHEPLNIAKITGIGLIIAGVFVLTR